ALVRDWRDAKCPRGKVGHASFDEWGRTIGGILEHAGYRSPIQPPAIEGDEELSAFTEFVHFAVAAGATEVDPSELMDLARQSKCFGFGAVEEPTGEESSKRKNEERTKLGSQCKRYAGRTFTLADGARVNFASIGKSHSRKYRFTRR